MCGTTDVTLGSLRWEWPPPATFPSYSLYINLDITSVHLATMSSAVKGCRQSLMYCVCVAEGV